MNMECEVFMGEEFAEELRQALLANDAKKIDELMKRNSRGIR